MNEDRLGILWFFLCAINPGKMKSKSNPEAFKNLISVLSTRDTGYFTWTVEIQEISKDTSKQPTTNK